MIPGGRVLLVVAALAEELQTALESLGPRGSEGPIRFLKTGVGPERAARGLRRALEKGQADWVLIAGYAGALDPGLRVGDLVAAQLAILLSRDGDVLETRELCACDYLLEQAKAARLSASRGDMVTSYVPVVDPRQRSLLFTRFGAAAVDMETAALARVAACFHVPVACVRVITDEAGETCPSSKAKTYRSSWWEARSAVARTSLKRFFAAFFQAGGLGQP